VDLKVVGAPNEFSPDTHLGERTYFARLAYNYLHEHVPADIITQNNPLGFLDRPSGLYGAHQMAISDRTIYGVPLETYQAMANDIGTIFTRQTAGWDFIDAKCRQYSIDILIVKDIDPIWNGLRSMRNERLPFYENTYYALYSCGNYKFSE
jgi:hypothetical protein